MQGLSITNLFGLIDCIKDRKALINWGTEGKILLSAVGVGRPRGFGTPSFLTITAPLLRACPRHWGCSATETPVRSVDRRDRSSLGHRRTSPGSAVRGDGRGARGLPLGPALPLPAGPARPGPARPGAAPDRFGRGGGAVPGPGAEGGAGRCCRCPETLASPAAEGRGLRGGGGAAAVGAERRARPARSAQRSAPAGSGSAAGAAARSHAGPGALSRPRRRPAQWRRRGGYRRQEPLCAPGALRDGDALPGAVRRNAGRGCGDPGRDERLLPRAPAEPRGCCNVMVTAAKPLAEQTRGFRAMCLGWN